MLFSGGFLMNCYIYYLLRVLFINYLQ